MDWKELKTIGMAAVLCLLTAASIRLATEPTKVLAATAATNFTITGVGQTGVVIANQTTGALTLCAEAVEPSGLGEPIGLSPLGSCKLLGRATPGTGTTSLSVSVSGNSIFVLNNQTGQTIQCAAGSILHGVGQPVGIDPLGTCGAPFYANQ